MSRSSVPQRHNKCLKDCEGEVSCIRTCNEPLLFTAFVYPFLVFMPRRRKECVMKKSDNVVRNKRYNIYTKKIQGGMIPLDPTLVAKDTCRWRETRSKDNAEVDWVVGDDGVYQRDRLETRRSKASTMRRTPHGSRRSIVARGCEQHGEAHRPLSQCRRC